MVAVIRNWCLSEMGRHLFKFPQENFMQQLSSKQEKDITKDEFGKSLSVVLTMKKHVTQAKLSESQQVTGPTLMWPSFSVCDLMNVIHPGSVETSSKLSMDQGVYFRG